MVPEFCDFLRTTYIIISPLHRFFFYAGSISNIDGAEYSCNKTQVRKVISGVVGAASSVTSIQVANLLRLFRIPQVSKRVLHSRRAHSPWRVLQLCDATAFDCCYWY